MAPPEQPRRWQSYFVRVGSLSAKLRHRALRRSLSELQRARRSAQQVLAQLHHIIELVRMRRGLCQPRTCHVLLPHCPFSQVEQGRQGTDGPRQHLHHMWLEWSQQDATVPVEDCEVRSGHHGGHQGVRWGELWPWSRTSCGVGVPVEDTKVWGGVGRACGGDGGPG